MNAARVKSAYLRKQAKHIQEQLKETQNGKTYSLNAPGMMAKPEARAQSRVQLQTNEALRRDICIVSSRSQTHMIDKEARRHLYRRK
ncbi:UNVERIFIED_CONTAM: hypothetical protein K2H54_015854 [Gekko kuhli]